MASTSNPEDIKQVIIIRADLRMGKGKIAAQTAHASLDAYIKAKAQTPQIVDKWMRQGMQKTVLKVDGEKELMELCSACKEMGIVCSIITDAGKTQIEPGSRTCIGIGPGKSEIIDRISGELKLL